MPKFLDVPSWYNNNGILVSGNEEIKMIMPGNNSSIYLDNCERNTHYRVYMESGTQCYVYMPESNNSIRIAIMAREQEGFNEFTFYYGSKGYSTTGTYTAFIMVENIGLSIPTTVSTISNTSTLPFDVMPGGRYAFYTNVLKQAEQPATSFNIYCLNSVYRLNGGFPIWYGSEIYAPTVGGALGQVVGSNGSGAGPSWKNIYIHHLYITRSGNFSSNTALANAVVCLDYYNFTSSAFTSFNDVQQSWTAPTTNQNAFFLASGSVNESGKACPIVGFAYTLMGSRFYYINQAGTRTVQTLFGSGESVIPTVSDAVRAIPLR